MTETAGIIELKPETAKKHWAVSKKRLSARLAERTRRGA